MLVGHLQEFKQSDATAVGSIGPVQNIESVWIKVAVFIVSFIV